MITFDDTPTLRAKLAPKGKIADANGRYVPDDGRTTTKTRPPVGPKLADPTPPVPPADLKALMYGSTHHVVTWFVGGIRKEAYATKELAFSELERVVRCDGPIGAYKVAVTNGRDIIKCNTITVD